MNSASSTSPLDKTCRHSKQTRSAVNCLHQHDDEGRDITNESGTEEKGGEIKSKARRAKGGGRRPGTPAWNKGVPSSRKARENIAKGMRKKWTDPEYRVR